jgi:AcrR family transcriptional regulator
MGRPVASTIEVDTPTRLLEAAEAAFASAGYAGAKLADIARGAGIRRSSLLYHFRSKQDLYAAVVQRVFDDLGLLLMRVMEGEEEFEVRVRGMVETFAAFLDRRPGLAPVVLREMLDGHGPGREILMRRVVPLLDVVERFILVQGRGTIRAGLPVRAALMEVVANLLMRAAASDLRTPLWGPGDHAWSVTRVILFESPAEN